MPMRQVLDQTVAVARSSAFIGFSLASAPRSANMGVGGEMRVRRMTAVVVACAVVVALTAVATPSAEACGNCPPSIEVSGPLTQPVVSRAAQPIPVEIAGVGGLADVRVWYDGALVKSLEWVGSPYVGDVGPFDASPSGPYRPGPHTVKIAAHAAVDGGYAERILSFTVSSGPGMDVGGQLRQLAGQTVFPGSYKVDVSASDAASGDSDSGVKHLELRVDDDVVDVADQPCDGAPCGGLAATFWFNTESLAAGDHTVSVLARDGDDAESIESWSIAANPTRTYFQIEPGASLDAVVQAVAGTGAQWIEFGHSGVDVGGFQLGNQSPESGVSAYRDDYADEHGAGTEPNITDVAIGGSVEAASLGSLANEAVDREVVTTPAGGDDHVDETVFDDGPEYPDDLMAADAAAEDQGFDDRPDTLGVMAAAAGPKSFAPSFGMVNTFNTFLGKSERPRRIVHTLTFPREAVGDMDGDGDKDESPFERSGFFDHGYEHDFKLIDPDYSGHGAHPLCHNVKDRFWARDRGRTWSTTFPKDAHPYLDTNLSDSCRYLDFTIGVKYPLNLSPKKTYYIRIRARAGDQRYSRYELSAEMTDRYCGGNPAFCSDAHDRQALAGPRAAVRTMECRRWRKGYSSRRVCDYLESGTT